MKIWITFINNCYYTLIDNKEIKVKFSCDKPKDENVKIKVVDGEIINDEFIIYDYDIMEDIIGLMDNSDTIICSSCGTKYYRKQDDCPNCHTDNPDQITGDE